MNKEVISTEIDDYDELFENNPDSEDIAVNIKSSEEQDDLVNKVRIDEAMSEEEQKERKSDEKYWRNDEDGLNDNKEKSENDQAESRVSNIYEYDLFSAEISSQVRFKENFKIFLF